ncbi:hypothetical protein [Streptomyces sp. NPDC054804]
MFTQVRLSPTVVLEYPTLPELTAHVLAALGVNVPGDHFSVLHQEADGTAAAIRAWLRR